MKFPGKRKRKHYFPPDSRKRLSGGVLPSPEHAPLQRQFYIVGIDQPLVDIEVRVTEEFLERYGLAQGESIILEDDVAEKLYTELKREHLISGEYAGGAVGNTLHNFTVLANSRAVLLGTINRDIQVGDYAFRYVCLTSSLVDLSYLQPCEKPMGRAICFILPNGERSFGISRGCMNDLQPESIPEDVIANASLLLITAFLLRDPSAPLFESTMHAIQLARKHDVPVILNLGTSFLLEQDPQYWRSLLKEHIDVVAMNESEAEVLTGESRPLLAIEHTLDWCDLVLLTRGERGLYVGAHCDDISLRETSHELYTKGVEDYNQYEYSRAMRRQDCEVPIKIYSHINPYQGGPEHIRTTNGAGDAALSALLHDIAANHYHKTLFPNAVKHNRPFITYSSIAQICKYSNRVSYEILVQNSPRLMYGLPEREDSLEEGYWEM